MSRVSSRALVELADTMPERTRQVVEAVGHFKLLAGSQLGRLFFVNIVHAASRGRAVRRETARLAAQHILYPLPRQVGGVRAGSAGQVVALGPVGKRLIAYWQGAGLVRVRAVHEPEPLFVRHTLAVAEQFVQLIEAERVGTLELLAFDAEPACWRTSASPSGGLLTLKPDALVRLGLGDFEQRSFLEVDLGSEGRGALAAKCRAYVTYYQSGQEQATAGVFPRVVWLTTTPARVRLLVEVCASLPAEYWQLFSVGMFDRLLALTTGNEPFTTQAAADAP